jgi:uncharacterized membrane protein YgdD (TMEM256/DUF423 family)
MKLSDDPWFRRSWPLGFYPINRNGLATGVCVLVGALGALVASDYFANPVVSWMFTAAAFIIFGSGVVIAFSHMEDK